MSSAEIVGIWVIWLEIVSLTEIKEGMVEIRLHLNLIRNIQHSWRNWVKLHLFLRPVDLLKVDHKADLLACTTMALKAMVVVQDHLMQLLPLL